MSSEHPGPAPVPQRPRTIDVPRDVIQARVRTGEVCLHCRYGVVFPRLRDPVTGAIDLAVPQLVQCRFFPPTLQTPAGAQFPTMQADAWCGQFDRAGRPTDGEA